MTCQRTHISGAQLPAAPCGLRAACSLGDQDCREGRGSASALASPIGLAQSERLGACGCVRPRTEEGILCAPAAQQVSGRTPATVENLDAIRSPGGTSPRWAPVWSMASPRTSGVSAEMKVMLMGNARPVLAPTVALWPSSVSRTQSDVLTRKRTPARRPRRSAARRFSRTPPPPPSSSGAGVPHRRRAHLSNT